MAEGSDQPNLATNDPPRWPGLWAAGLCALAVASAHHFSSTLPFLTDWPAPIWIIALAIAPLIIASSISLRAARSPRSQRLRHRSVLALLATSITLIALASALLRLHHPPAHWLPDLLDPPASAAAEPLSSASADRLLIVQGIVREHLTAPSPDNTSRFDIHAPQRLLSGVGFRTGAQSRPQFTLELTGVQLAGVMHPASGILRIFSPDFQSSPPPLGSTIELTGQYRPPRQFSRLPNTLESSHPSLPSSSLIRARLIHQRTAGTLTVDALSGANSTCTILNASASFTQWPSIWLQHARLKVQQQLAHALERQPHTNSANPAPSASASSPSPSATALLTSMMLGQDDTALSPPVESDLARLGMAHVLSVSGFHLVIITACVVWVARALTDSHRTVATITIIAIILYALLVPLESPVIRSACQAITVVLAGMYQRRYEPLNVLGYIAGSMLLIWPMELWSAGFQLSFLVTGGLLAFGPRWMKAADDLLRWQPPGVKGRIRPPKSAFAIEVLRVIRKSLAAIVGSTLLAQTLSSAIVIYHTGTLPLGGILLGMIATPLTTVALIAGFAGLAITLLLPAIGAWLLQIAGAICHLVLDIAHIARGSPFLWADLPMIPAWTAILTTLGIITLIATRQRTLRAAGLACTLAGLGSIITYCLTANTLNRALLIRLERYNLTQQSPASTLQTQGQIILIDPGTGLGIAPPEPPIRQAFALRRAIQSSHRWHIETCILTGAEPWRFDLLPELLTPLGIKQVIIAPDLAAVARDQPGSPAHRLLRTLTDRGITITPMDTSLTLTLTENTRLTIAPGTLRLELPQGALELDRPPMLDATTRWSLTQQGTHAHERWLQGAWQRWPATNRPQEPSLLRWYPAEPGAPLTPSRN